MTPRPPRPDLRQLKAAGILEAAAAVFARTGYRRARMADVAAQAGVGKGTLYEYFRAKEELFLAVFDGYVQATMSAARVAAERTDDPVEALRAFLERTLASLDEMLPIYPLTLEFWAAAAGSELGARLKQEFREMYRRYGELVAEMIRTGVETGVFVPDTRPEEVARVMVGAIDGLFLQAWLDPEFDARRAGATFLEVVLEGLAADRPPAGQRRPDEKGRYRS
jgi:AcrR family transcriptional regulator